MLSEQQKKQRDKDNKQSKIRKRRIMTAKIILNADGTILLTISSTQRISLITLARILTIR